MLGTRLDLEWRHLVTSPATTTALARWRRLEPAVGRWADLDALRGAVHDRSNLERADQILAALVRLAAVTGHGDQLAARVVLQLLIPGAIRLAQSLAGMIGDAQAAEAAVFAELAIGIRTYPWQRRPQRIAANLLLDCRQRLTRSNRRSFPETPAGLAVHEPTTADDSGWQDWHDLMALLRWACREQVLTPMEAGLLLTHHVLDIPIAELVSVFGRSRSTLFTIRTRAELRLRKALSAGVLRHVDAYTGANRLQAAPAREPQARAAGHADARSPGRVPAAWARQPAAPAGDPATGVPTARPGSRR